MEPTVERLQQETCRKHNARCVPSPAHLKVGIAENVKERLYPVNGLRIPPEGDTTGWYIWAGQGEPSTDPNFFKPLHVAHVKDWCPDVIPYLGLPPGWRFLIAPGYEDVWFDEKLLK